MSRHKEKAEPAGWCSVVVCIHKMEQRGQGVQAEEDKMGPRWWKKCQRKFSNPSLRLLVEK